ncbi:PREDICTED: WAT1-related protein At4g01440-like isoform X2 [Nelumbo nucifera]|uniref:WAT1-related protein n=1 Tax=Nelumbo nucifera TaxID=4432 RepID=A0A1U7YRC0_NELNU|nr:PREDICTED: WAT1-related protein At4g01440-like isoform X2 [Nelumbo nucifera]
MAEMKWYEEGKPVFVMVAINFFLAIVNILLKKVLDEGMNNLVIITYRQCLATSFLAPIAYFWERKSRPKLTSRILCHIFLGAIVGPTLTQYFFLLGIQYTSATFSCAFINVVPVLTFLMALPFGLETVNLKSKAGRAKLLGTVVCVGGAMMLTLYKGLPLTNRPSSQASTQMTNQASSRFSPQKRAERWTIGTIALVAGSIFWSSWFLIQARISKQYPCQYSSTAIMSFFSAIQSAVLSLVIERDISLWVLRGKAAILTVLYARIGICSCDYWTLYSLVGKKQGGPELHDQAPSSGRGGSSSGGTSLSNLVWLLIAHDVKLLESSQKLLGCISFEVQGAENKVLDVKQAKFSLKFFRL